MKKRLLNYYRQIINKTKAKPEIESDIFGISVLDQKELPELR